MADTENHPKPKFYRLYELEFIANDILKDSEKYFNSFRFDIESFIVEQHNLILDPYFNLKSKHDTWAFLLVGSNRIFIDHKLMDDDRTENKYRFTLAEEFSHYIIHRDIYSTWKTLEERNSIYYGFSDDERNRMENNARALASALLMPKAFVEEKVSKLMEDTNNNIGDIMVFLAKKISNEFYVNFTAAKSRLKMLGYHKRLQELID